MPFIHLKTTEKISKESEERLQREFGELICLLPGKSEEWLMTEFSDKCRLHFKGECEGVAIIEISVFGKCEAEDYNKLTKAITNAVFFELLIPGDRIYVKYTECEHWGYDGENF